MSLSNPFTITISAAYVIANKASALGAGGSDTTLADNTSGISGDLPDIQWVNRFHYDNARGVAHMLGKAASGGVVNHFKYDAAGNSWTAQGHISETGHIYECIAYDPATETMYNAGWPNGGSGNNFLRHWLTGTALNNWQTATSTYSPYINPNTQPAICWFPNAFGTGDGAVLAIAYQGNTRTLAWRKSNNQWYQYTSTQANAGTSDYVADGAIEYIRSGNYCISTYANQGNTMAFRINAGSGGAIGSATSIANVPISCYGQISSFSGAGGILIDDPAGVGGPYIIEKKGTNRVWKWNGSSWALQGFTHPFPNGSQTTDTNWCIASCYPLGVFWCQDNTSATPSRLWKPNA